MNFMPNKLCSIFVVIVLFIAPEVIVADKIKISFWHSIGRAADKLHDKGVRKGYHD